MVSRSSSPWSEPVPSTWFNPANGTPSRTCGNRCCTAACFILLSEWPTSVYYVYMYVCMHACASQRQTTYIHACIHAYYIYYTYVYIHIHTPYRKHMIYHVRYIYPKVQCDTYIHTYSTLNISFTMYDIFFSL
jgi:hypothetical protein